MCREVEVEERIGALFCRDVLGRKQAAYLQQLTSVSTMHTITEVRDVSEQTHLANYLCLMYADW